MKKQLLLIISVFVMLCLSITVFAQDDTGAEIIGDSESEALRVVQNFLGSFDTSLLSEDVRYRDTSWAQGYEGRGNIGTIFQNYYNGVFTEVSTQPIRFIVSTPVGEGEATEDQLSGAGEQIVVAEYNVMGVNTGDYNMNPATGANVSIPTVSIFRVQDGTITEITTYSDQTALHQQLGIQTMGYMDPMTMGGTAGDTTDQEAMTEEADDVEGAGTSTTDAAEPTPMASDPGTGEGQGPGEEVGLDTVLDDPDAYYGQRLTIEDELVEAVNERVFMIQDNDLIDADQLVVIYTGEDALGMDVFATADEDRTVRVTGTLRQFFMTEFQNEFGATVDFSDERFADWEERAVLVADSVTLVEAEAE